MRSFRLTAAGSGPRLAVAPPARAYRGFPFVASVTTQGIDTGADVAVPLRRGRSWRTISHTARTAHQRGGDQAAAHVKPGKYGLRARAKVGDDT